MTVTVIVIVGLVGTGTSVAPAAVLGKATFASLPLVAALGEPLSIS